MRYSEEELTELFEERAAIVEFMGGENRGDAESVAARETCQLALKTNSTLPDLLKYHCAGFYPRIPYPSCPREELGDLVEVIGYQYRVWWGKKKHVTHALMDHEVASQLAHATRYERIEESRKTWKTLRVNVPEKALSSAASEEPPAAENV